MHCALKVQALYDTRLGSYDAVGTARFPQLLYYYCISFCYYCIIRFSPPHLPSILEVERTSIALNLDDVR